MLFILSLSNALQTVLHAVAAVTSIHDRSRSVPLSLMRSEYQPKVSHADCVHHGIAVGDAREDAICILPTFEQQSGLRACLTLPSAKQALVNGLDKEVTMRPAAEGNISSQGFLQALFCIAARSQTSLSMECPQPSAPLSRKTLLFQA